MCSGFSHFQRFHLDANIFRLCAHMASVTLCFSAWYFECLFICMLLFVWCSFCAAINIYSQHDLLKIEVCNEWTVSAEFLDTHTHRGHDQETRISVDYHPRGKETKALPGEEAEARLQERRASQAKETATWTTVSQPFSYQCQIPRQTRRMN